MGVFLSKPCLHVNAEEGAGNGVKFVAGEMQGWRKNHEDAHIAEPLSAVDGNKAALFGVFDGHGGKEVALFVKEHFVPELTQSKAFKEGRYQDALREAFHRMDEMLEDESNEESLKVYRKVPNPSDIYNTEGKEEAASLSDLVGEGENDEDGEKRIKDGGKKIDKEALFNFLVKQLLGKLPDADNDDGTGEATLAVANENENEDEDENENENENEEDADEAAAQVSIASIIENSTKEDDGEEESEGAVAASSSVEEVKTIRNDICRLPNHRVTAGCTAVVALKVDDLLIVANAGDSRGVLCRDGKAFALSEDHKPRSEIESTRIKKAGGFVTTEGRVNGNLNLSRSLGDLKYKQVKGVSREGQIISAEPDITITKLEPGDSFFVLACDGVWDIMSNDDIVEFISERLAKGQPLNEIVDAIFKHCVADNPRNTGGLGGDNMTCVIVLLNDTTNQK